ncbi:MAG: sulfotransferase [Gammaproteobacteria bacterium]|nr:sulfotransferase [Gammaproteobacteria bacterium]MYE50046.1 sulfotransferase [Gammaproteobacteria bacterium]MYF50754.1 sulfotransferase [Gammaproteobacteria bacterium]MYH15694.1 sulfotransferase [Gammaproteobacteria bacterium]MYK82948.1 sulfotransferase [Gammaproteobacteria bacterium]
MKPIAETPTDYARPYRPWPVAAFNALARRTPRAGSLRRLDADRMLANARRRTGLEDLGDERCLTALRVLVRAINDEAELTPTGVLLQRQRIEGALANRLRAQQMLKRHPQIHDLELGKVVLIAGLQRTGTTALHRLVASHPDMRALMSWEALNPAPLPGEGDRGFDRRLRRGRLAERTIAYLAPAFFAVHPIDHDAPEEDILLLDLSFMSQTAEATMRVPSYATWLEGQDHAPAYRDLRTLLKVLHWQRPAKHWVLKTPHHLEHLDVAFKTFPDLTLVQTHRDPQVALASFLSMVAHGRGVFSDRVDAKAIARHWTAKVCRMIERAEAVRCQTDPARFVDVLYRDLLRDPKAQLERIYRQAGIPFCAEAQGAAALALKRNPQHRHGKHIYNAADFGLGGTEAGDGFAAYRARYRIPSERSP